MTENGQQSNGFSFDRFKLWPNQRLLMDDDEIVHLTPRVFDLLEMLVKNSGQVVTKDDLLSTVWAGRTVEEGNINRTISTLRKHLGVQISGTDFIETVPSVGYRFLPQTSILEPEQRSPVKKRSFATGHPRPKTVALILLLLTACIAIAAFGWLRLSRQVSDPTAKNVLIRLTTSELDERNPTFTTDGRVRFFRDASYAMNADGSDVRRDESIANLSIGFWAPDGTKVMFYKQGDTKTAYLANADGSGEVKLPFTFGNCQWSAGGKRFLFQNGVKRMDGGVDSNIYVYDLETGSIDAIVDSPFFDGDPSFAPDEGSILFVSDRDGNLEIYSKDLTTGEIRRLTDDPAHDAFPSYSPDGTQILFSSARDKDDRDIFIMNADGTGVRQIVDLDSNESVGNAAWSRDGTKILLLSDASGTDNVYVMNIEPFEPRPLFPENSDQMRSIIPIPGKDAYVAAIQMQAENVEFWTLDSSGHKEVNIASTNILQAPNISPDGSNLAFAARIEGNSEVFTVAIGGEPTNISNHPNADAAPAWSPDGRRLVFASNRGDNRAANGLFIMNSDGTEQRQLYFANSFATDPKFSPDGSRIFFSDDKIGGKIGNFELFSINAETGTDEQRLTFRRRYDVLPTISPDSKHIAFVSGNGNSNSEIYLANIDGSGVIRLTRDASEDTNPIFSLDGKTILFSSNRSGHWAAYYITLP
ncbi:MAG: PD40 domain-containing protein [Acidobacteria bacterium]|nr:PD40 domain-containing protein [Acidobacteriota bacterium]